MITWGIIASSTAFIQGEISFYVVRVLLGIAEAGFFPGIILYLTYWFPRAKRAKIVVLMVLPSKPRGFASGYMVGWLEDLTGSFRAAMWMGAGFIALAGVIALICRRLPATSETRQATRD